MHCKANIKITMPPAAAYDYCLIIFDVNTENKQKALQTLLEINYVKQFIHSKDVYNIVLTNVNSTNNVLNYKNIHVLNEEQIGLLCLKNTVDEFPIGNSCWLESMQVCIEYLKKHHGKAGLLTLQLVFLTDMENGSTNNVESKITSIINDLKKYSIYLYFVGVPIQPPHTLISPNDLKHWMKNFSFDNGDVNLKLVKRIVENTAHTIICNYDMGLHILFSYKNHKGSQPWLVPLSFGTKLAIPMRTSRITKEEQPFKISCQNYREPSSEVGTWVTDDDQETPMDSSISFISGISMHGKFVRIDSEEMFKILGGREFSIIGFTDSKLIPEYFMRGDGTNFVVPDDSKPEGFLELSTCLMKKMVENNKYGIVRRVYNKNNVPKYFVIIPIIDSEPKRFNMVELPFADDIRHDYVEMDVRTATKVEQKIEVLNFLDTINVHKENCSVNISLGPSMMFDPNCLNIIRTIDQKYSKTSPHLTNPGLDIIKNDIQSTELSDNFKAIWPAREEAKLENYNEEEEFDEYADFFD